MEQSELEQYHYLKGKSVRVKFHANELYRGQPGEFIGIFKEIRHDGLAVEVLSPEDITAEDEGLREVLCRIYSVCPRESFTSTELIDEIQLLEPDPSALYGAFIGEV